MNGWVLGGIIVVAVAAVVLRRLIGEPVNPRDLWVPPVVLTGIGLWILVRTSGLRPADYAWLVAGCVLGTALGYWRGRAVVVFEKGGALWQRYDGRTFAVVIGSLLVMAGFGLVAARLGMRPEARPVQLGIGLSFLGEALAVTRRGRRAGRLTDRSPAPR
ncbi:hypothetical protein BJY16_006421 [Actinoplanes octamycinicus]|uniref:DUF1453 domain-containing protein n=1 Tax=Actinoplanes octamycinicus TaxID=135948 RepID=A0A7W7H300_9ACTN|nr:DUF1453 domain-containing protein [Actinoplanes octamycinicus]MBB4742962.1 hypothetical protein [Actinoplanes octamycinicus]GIE58185.1 hypothetical protein Aoc01nite_35870 [Actinoplanes octamycinicus]